VQVVDGDQVPADEAGKVSNQSPAADKVVREGTKVTIWVDVEAPTTEPTGTPTAPPT
jgi:serine/threonine-protein kinase